MSIKVIITGSTGMVGKGALLECLNDSSIGSVMIINRQPLGWNHEKLKEIILKNFFDLSEIRNQLSGYDACLFCLGVSSAGLPENEYYRVTYDLTINFARAILELNPNMVFCYVSGAGTDSTEKGRIKWARVKGKTENTLMTLGFKAAYMFRPALIQPVKGIKSKTRIYNLVYAILKPLYPLLKLFPGFFLTTGQVGKGLINAVVLGSEKKILESKDIWRLAELQN